MLRTLLCTSLLTALLTAQAPAVAPLGDADAHQILWQRSLEDALALAKAQDRPLLLAVNMDGESASDRIVRELYRDPAFVAATRHCVCLVASVFRHNPRDYDDQGRRIPCPRLGEVTCGEHMALEPILFEKYLADGERVAPRHALILQDGKKAWDLSLCFDLRDIDKQLEESVRAEHERRAKAGIAAPDSRPATPDPATARAGEATPWAALAERRDQRGRAAFEAALLGTQDEPALAAAIAALAQHGNGGSIGALRILCAKVPRHGDELRAGILDVTRKLQLESAVAEVLREQLRAFDRDAPTTDSAAGEAAPAIPEPAAAAAADRARAVLPLLAALDAASPATRSLLLACRTIEGYGAPAVAALRQAFGSSHAAIEAALAAHGGALSLPSMLQAAQAVTRAGASAKPAARFPTAGTITDAMPPADQLERELNELDARMKQENADAALLARYAKATLDLGRRRIEEKQKDSQLLLEDAALHFQRALDKQPEHCEWWIERARTAYFLERFADEADYGRRALAIASGRAAGELPQERAVASALAAAAPASEQAPAILDDPRAIEALRWIGDGDARLLAERSGKDPAIEIGGIVEGMRALGLVAASPYGDANDWTSFASFLGALGLWREDLAITETAARRLPNAPEIRKHLNDLLWSGGRIDLAAAEADALAAAAPSADTMWFAGYAWTLEGENHRRTEQPQRAIAAYDLAERRFERAVALRPDYSPNCNYFIALAWLGRAMAQLRAERREAAADCLVRAVAADPRITGARDGLDYDALDAVDRLLEWRESGASAVPPLGLLDRLEAADPHDPFWAVAVADSELREALRADGRNPQRVERATVDAAGKKIVMPMGKPTEEGDGYLRASIEAGRRAIRISDAPESKQPLAQSDTIWAERMLERGRLDGVQGALAQAAPLLGFDAPSPDAGEPALRELAGKLRAALGDARPRLRPGR